VRWNLIRHNPAVDASPPRVPKPGIHAPAPQQVAEIFTNLPSSDRRIQSETEQAAEPLDFGRSVRLRVSTGHGDESLHEIRFNKLTADAIG
jgi:hypothetical protein